MQRAILFLLLALIPSCSDWDTPTEVKNQAAHSDSVVLCSVDVACSSVRFRVEQTIKTNDLAPSQFAEGQILPVSGPRIEQGTSYGDEAMVFLSSRPAGSGVSANFILVLHNGKTGNKADSLSRDDLIKLVKETQKK